MARILIAAAAEESRLKLSRLLAASGYSVFRVCGSGSELRRSINECQDGIVILAGLIPDCKPDELQWDYGSTIQILLIGKPFVLESCESREIFRLPLPASSQAVIGAVEMLSQLHRMRLPQRGGADRQMVEQAKKILMEKHGISEPEAHRALQQHAMRTGKKMTEYAEMIVNSSEATDFVRESRQRER